MPQKTVNSIPRIALIGALYLSLQSATPREGLANSADGGEALEGGRHTAIGRTGLHKHMAAPVFPAIDVYKQRVYDLIIGSTPFGGEADLWGTKKFPSAIMSFDLDEKGYLSNLKFNSLSGSLATDFWTMYATASFPPIEPPTDTKTPLAMSLNYLRMPPIASRAAEEWRAKEAESIPRKSNAKCIFFSLIPASFIEIFPGTVGIDTICDKSNLVGIPVEKLSNRANYWTLGEANDALKSHGDLVRFLGEWPIFFKRNPHPSKQEILSFAEKLKTKYRSLVKEGEPEAPLL